MPYALVRQIVLLIVSASPLWIIRTAEGKQGNSASASELRDRDALAVDPKHFQFQFENQRIRVLRLTLRGDEAVPFHSSPEALLVCVNECHIRLQERGPRIHDIHMDAGETRWTPSFPRAERNLGSKPLEILIIEFK